MFCCRKHYLRANIHLGMDAMYDRHLLRRRVLAEIDGDPRLTLRAISVRLGIDRHTITRSLAEVGLNFRDIRHQAALRALDHLLAVEPLLCRKELACRLGFPSYSAFAHFFEDKRAPCSSGAYRGEITSRPKPQ
jgi:AraC-like DNA-binding protein